MSSYIDTLIGNYICITSQNDIDNKLKYKTKDTLIVYHYKCRVESFKDIIEASRIMLVNNIKLLKTINNSNINEWQFYSLTTLEDLKIYFKKSNYSLNLLISSINLRDDFI
jgi:hypothetical protein